MKPACTRGHLPTKAYRAESEGREANIMKRAALWVVGIAVLVSVGLLTVEQGFAIEKDGAPKCTLSTLKGRYLFSAPAVVFPPAFGVSETSVGNAAGFHIFNGDGTGHDYVTLTLNGVVVPVPSPNDLTYTLNADCTGTYEVLGGGPTFDIFVSPTGDEMTAINTNKGVASSYTPSRRVWPK
jgi:hypothetical protein